MRPGAREDEGFRGRARPLRALIRWLALSLALHLPATPLLGLLGLALAVRAPEDDLPPPPPLNEIPLEILSETSPAEAPLAAPSEPAAPSADPAPALPREAPEEPKPKPPAKPESKASPAPSASAVPPSEDPGQDKAERKPLAMTGAKGVVDPNANVRILIDSERLRGHALAPRIGKMLGSVHQWRDFFGPTGIDPVNDIDRMFIVGPQLRDSSAVVAMIQHHIPKAKLREALDVLVKRDPNGEWLDGKVPVAKARADRASRYFVSPGANLLVVTPESALKSAERLKANIKLPTSPVPEVVWAHVETPWRAFIGLPVDVPRSLRWAELRVSPDEDGGATIYFEAEDQDAAHARSNAAYLERSIASGLDLLASASNIFALLFGGNTKKLFQRIEFHSEEARVLGKIEFSEAQVVDIVDRVGRMIGARSARPRAAASGSATPAVPPPGR